MTCLKLIYSFLFPVAVISCQNYVSDQSLSQLMTYLWGNDTNGVPSNSLKLNYQGIVNSNDSFSKLFPSDFSLPSSPTYEALQNLLNSSNPKEKQNYNLAHLESTFLDSVLDTKVGGILSTFFQKQGYATSKAGVKKLLDDLWFTRYHRSKKKRKEVSTGFKHLFEGEKNGKRMSGLHSWVRVLQLERSNQFTYLGYYNYIKKPHAINIKFSWEGATKKESSMFVGSSPELDLSVYSVCAFVWGGESCEFQVYNRNLTILTHLVSEFENTKSVLATAFLSNLK